VTSTKNTALFYETTTVMGSLALGRRSLIRFVGQFMITSSLMVFLKRYIHIPDDEFEEGSYDGVLMVVISCR
jgi:hypothetical protein